MKTNSVPYRAGTLAALALLVGCAGATRTLAPEQSAQAYPFHARTANVRGDVYEELRGTVYTESGGLRVVVRSGYFQTQPTSARRPTVVRAGLAYGDTATGWNYRTRSAELPVAAVRARGDTLADSLVFVIPVNRGLDLRAHWLAFDMHSVIQPSGGTQWYEATHPMHADRDVFNVAAPTR